MPDPPFFLSVQFRRISSFLKFYLFQRIFGFAKLNSNQVVLRRLNYFIKTVLGIVWQMLSIQNILSWTRKPKTFLIKNLFLVNIFYEFKNFCFKFHLCWFLCSLLNFACLKGCALFYNRLESTIWRIAIAFPRLQRTTGDLNDNPRCVAAKLIISTSKPDNMNEKHWNSVSKHLNEGFLSENHVSLNQRHKFFIKPMLVADVNTHRELFSSIMQIFRWKATGGFD